MHDIREVLEIGKGQAPPPPYGVDDIVAAGQRRRRRLLTQRIGGAGVVAVGLAVSGLLVANTAMVSANHPANQPVNQPNAAPPNVAAGQPAPAVAIAPFTFMFDTYSAGAFRVLPPQVVTATYQDASIVADYKDTNGGAAIAYVGTLTLYRPGVAPPAGFLYGTKVTVHGQPGFANERDQDTYTYVNGSGKFGKPSIRANTLAWQYGVNGWAVINSIIEMPSDLSHRMSAADELALADAFSLGAPSRARIPLQAGHLPAGWQLASVSGRSFTAEDLASVTVIFGPASAVAGNKVRHFADAGDGPAVVMTIIRKQVPAPPDAPKTKATCHPFETDTDLACSWDIPHSAYAVVVRDPSNTLSETELVSIGESLTFDNLDQPDTWHQIP